MTKPGKMLERCKVFHRDSELCSYCKLHTKQTWRIEDWAGHSREVVVITTKCLQCGAEDNIYKRLDHLMTW